ncbi:MAG: alpha-hydroxy acid oxidase [Paracoccaceae bacterium]|nr:alpha-hydroxy acid oxidase [Paracoccaceae bacterium]
MNLDQKYPALSDLRAVAQKRIPKFVWDYLTSATGDETTLARNRHGLDQILFMPSVLHGEFEPDIHVDLLGESHPLPFGVAPVGMSGLIWPDAERRLAAAATSASLPYTLSTVACQTPETVGPHLDGKGWFQLYPPRAIDIRKDTLKRAKDSGFRTLVLTLDVPVASRRERQTRSGLTHPPVLTPRLLAQIALRPSWVLGMARFGRPTMPLIESYAKPELGMPTTAHIGYLIRTAPDWSYLNWIREAWDGPLVVKGVLNAKDVAGLEAAGVDSLWVSNHAGRQFDAAPAAIDMLPTIRQATDLPLIFDGGISGGLDILRAIALGADFIMLGTAWLCALAALGSLGPAHMIDILRKDLYANMGQMGTKTLSEAKTRLIKR